MALLKVVYLINSVFHDNNLLTQHDAQSFVELFNKKSTRLSLIKTFDFPLHLSTALNSQILKKDRQAENTVARELGWPILHFTFRFYNSKYALWPSVDVIGTIGLRWAPSTRPSSLCFGKVTHTTFQFLFPITRDFSICRSPDRLSLPLSKCFELLCHVFISASRPYIIHTLRTCNFYPYSLA